MQFTGTHRSEEGNARHSKDKKWNNLNQGQLSDEESSMHAACKFDFQFVLKIADVCKHF